VPSDLEATALAALALDQDAKAPWRADLGATLLAAYTPGRGWGDGRTNLLALRAVIALLKDKLPEKVRIVLEQDGKPLREGQLDARHVRDTLVLDAPAPGAAGRHVYTVRAEPAVPGLGFSLSLQGWVPWKDGQGAGGLQLSIGKADGGPLQGHVGAPVEVRVEAAAPAGSALRIRHALPAGAQADTASLDALVSSGTLVAWRAEEGAVVLDAPALAPGQSFSASYRIVPTLGGRLRTGPSSVALLDRPDASASVAPQQWQFL
jgi:hypothetical protein